MTKETTIKFAGEASFLGHSVYGYSNVFSLLILSINKLKYHIIKNKKFIS